MNQTEMPLDLRHAAQCVERRRGHDGGGSHLTSRTSMLDHTIGLRVDAPRQHRHSATGNLDGRGQYLTTPLIRGEHDFA